MTEPELKDRTKQFALRAIRLVDTLPRKVSSEVLGKQLLRSATSVGANYRSACRGRSTAEFVAKLGVVIEEADESEYWMELIAEAGLQKSGLVEPLRAEASELVAIFTASVKTAKSNSSTSRVLKSIPQKGLRPKA